MNPRFLMVTAGAACFVLAAAAGWSFTDPGSPPESARPPVPARSTVRAGREARNGPAAAARREMQRLRGISQPADRLRATLELAERIPVGEIRGWIEGRWFAISGGFDAELFRKILLNRWVAGDPEAALLWAADQRDSKDALEIRDTMAAADPRRLLAFFKSHPDPDGVARALAGIAKSNPALALESLAAMPDTGSGSGTVADFNLKNAFKMLAARMPDALKAALPEMSPNMAARAQGALFAHGLAVSFDATVAELAARGDGCGILVGSISDVPGLRDQILEKLSDLPPPWRNELAQSAYSMIDSKTAGRWLDMDLATAGFSPGQTQELQARALSLLAASDPKRAAEIFSTLDLGASRLAMIRDFFRNLTSADPAAAGQLRSTLTSQEEIGLASLSEVQTAASPDEWLERVRSAGNVAESAGALANLTGMWDDAKKAELTSRFHALPDGEKQRVAAVLAVSSWFGMSTRAEALAVLAGQPASDADPYAPGGNAAIDVSSFAVKWSATDPAAAAAWVSGLPENENGLWVRKNLARNWARYDPAAAGAWVDALPAGMQTGVRDFMKTGNP